MVDSVCSQHQVVPNEIGLERKPNVQSCRSIYDDRNYLSECIQREDSWNRNAQLYSIWYMSWTPLN